MKKLYLLVFVLVAMLSIGLASISADFEDCTPYCSYPTATKTPTATPIMNPTGGVTPAPVPPTLVPTQIPPTPVPTVVATTDGWRHCGTEFTIPGVTTSTPMRAVFNYNVHYDKIYTNPMTIQYRYFDRDDYTRVDNPSPNVSVVIISDRSKLVFQNGITKGVPPLYYEAVLDVTVFYTLNGQNYTQVVTRTCGGPRTLPQ